MHKLWIGLIISLIISLIVLIGAKVFIMPIYGEYNQLKTNLVTVTQLQKRTKLKLTKIKELVRQELNSKDIDCVFNYIKQNTTNLSEETMKKVAKEIVNTSWKNKLPFQIMVAIAQTASNFNPTKLNPPLRGIYQVNTKNIEIGEFSIRDLHTPKGGVQVGCMVIISKLKMHENWTQIIHELPYTTDIYQNLTNFIIFKHKYILNLQTNIVIKINEK